jgi:hypothetical protein
MGRRARDLPALLLRKAGGEEGRRKQNKGNDNDGGNPLDSLAPAPPHFPFPEENPKTA